jgi:catechol 2,3-dioxygenase-like lactoylglutathione lyase family enzyme
LSGVQAPGLAGVLETTLYHDGGGREAVERFYGDLLGLPAVAGWADGVAFRVGTGVLLLFDRGRLAARTDPIADHGASGPGHACLRSGPGEYERWREHLESAGVEIVHDQDWAGGRSFYFKDPAGNLLEIADRDIWPGSA